MVGGQLEGVEIEPLRAVFARKPSAAERDWLLIERRNGCLSSSYDCVEADIEQPAIVSNIEPHITRNVAVKGI